MKTSSPKRIGLKKDSFSKKLTELMIYMPSKLSREAVFLYYSWESIVSFPSRTLEVLTEVSLCFPLSYVSSVTVCASD
jgi:hypothetical protein